MVAEVSVMFTDFNISGEILESAADNAVIIYCYYRDQITDGIKNRDSDRRKQNGDCIFF